MYLLTIQFNQSKKSIRIVQGLEIAIYVLNVLLLAFVLHDSINSKSLSPVAFVSIGLIGLSALFLDKLYEEKSMTKKLKQPVRIFYIDSDSVEPKIDYITSRFYVSEKIMFRKYRCYLNKKHFDILNTAYKKDYIGRLELDDIVCSNLSRMISNDVLTDTVTIDVV